MSILEYSCLIGYQHSIFSAVFSMLPFCLFLLLFQSSFMAWNHGMRIETCKLNLSIAGIFYKYPIFTRNIQSSLVSESLHLRKLCFLSYPVELSIRNYIFFYCLWGQMIWHRVSYNVCYSYFPLKSLIWFFFFWRFSQRNFASILYKFIW